MNEIVQQHADFPSDETLAAYIDGRLDGETRERVTAHIAECADCYGWWETAMAGVDDQPNVVPFRRVRWLQPLAAAVVIATGMGVVFRQPIYELARPQWGIEKLAHATESREYFPTRTRLAGPFPDNKPPKPSYRGGNEHADPLNDVTIVAGEIEEAAKSRPTKDNLHALGVAYLLIGGDDTATSISTLERAIVKETGKADVHAAIQQSRDVALLNDLASAYVAVNRFKDASAAIEQAMHLDPQSLSVLYNRAYILQQTDPEAAKSAWQQYLRRDSTSAWANEAKKNLNPGF